MKEKDQIFYMRLAYLVATKSTCKRRKVGCVIVTPQQKILIGYNGTPPNTDNCCEDEDGFTLPHVIHAEDNAIRKSTDPLELINASVFITYGPCLSCIQLLESARIKELFYSDIQTKQDETQALLSCSFTITQIPRELITEDS